MAHRVSRLRDPIQTSTIFRIGNIIKEKLGKRGSVKIKILCDSYSIKIEKKLFNPKNSIKLISTQFFNTKKRIIFNILREIKNSLYT